MNAGATVGRYLTALRAHDWAELRSVLAPAVVRIGPYGDVYEGRDVYAAFLEALMPTLPGYRLDVGRVVDAGATVFVELTETVDAADGPLATDEGIVFDVDAGGSITRVAVYLQASRPG
jgi:ketosteroid isomerase-like protein